MSFRAPVLVSPTASRVLATLALLLVGAGSALHVVPARAAGTYEVFALPLQSPDAGPRTVEADPDLAGGVASPFGWHDTDGVPGAEYTIARGNNTHVYPDTDGDHLPDPGGEPDGGAGLSFQFPLDLTQEPSAYGDAAITNAFYWINVLHDVLYAAGFDEAAGNFQESNYGRGGLGGDAIEVELRRPGFNNAFWDVLPDGQPTRFRLLVFNLTNPDRDSALSAHLLAFLYGEAMAQRLVGGPATVSCLNADESEAMAYGWGDWLALVVTASAGDTGPDPRGLAPYLMGQPADGAGVRLTPYSTNMAVDFATYDDIRGGTQQKAGWVWATMLWDLYWNLVDAHGFSSDLYADPSAGGNVLALHLVVDAMKRLPCNPGFVDGRTALLEADAALTGGVNCDGIWDAFAGRGLGFSASQGSPASLNDGIEAYDVPPPGSCVAGLGAPVAGASPGLRLDAPSPFRGRTTITLTVPHAAPVRVRVFDVAGREVAALVDEPLDAGTHRWDWAPATEGGVSSSVLFVRATAGPLRTTRRIVHLR